MHVNGARAAMALVAVAMLAGCILTDPPATGVLVSGEIDGTSATQRYFKLYLKEPSGDVSIANFDRRDWYVTGLEREVTDRTLLSASVRGDDRGVLNEIVARDVVTPGELNEFLFENMEQRAVADGRSFDRVALDLEWDARLAALDAAPPPTSPTLALDDPLPR